MSQRNPMNDRYREENRGGKTRKSAASAKPSAERAATVRDPAPKTKKQKKEEARERERKREQKYTIDVPDNKRIENLPEYKRLRRLWWICLAGAIVLILLSVVVAGNEALNFLYVPFIIAGYLLVIAAFYIDFSKIRKLRNQHIQAIAQGKSKEARAAQKKARAEAREAQKEAEAKAKDAAENGEEEEAPSGLGARLKKALPFGNSSKKDEAEPAEDGSEAAQKDAAQK